ncbi:hypothetical protein RA167_12545 (plasmid) [Mycetohabitans endofungorum]|uniref:hypothetical protein n=1 Tax=Mycetohabitans endofungorum TaxID=417203 RepID=UPI0030D1B02B
MQMQPATHSDTPGAGATAPIRTAPATPVLPLPPVPAAPPPALSGSPAARTPTGAIQ